MQCPPTNAELLRGLRAVAAAGFEGFHDGLFGEIRQVQLGGIVSIADGAFLEEFFGEIFGGENQA